MKSIVAAILLFAHLAIAQLQPLPTGRIEGTIVRMDTNEPIAAAQVTLTLMNLSSVSSRRSQQKQTASSCSSASKAGRFCPHV